MLRHFDTPPMSGEIEDLKADVYRSRGIGHSTLSQSDKSVGVEFEQDLSIAIGFQGTIDRLLKLVEVIGVLDGRRQ
jgi:hypothetical protein